MKYLANGFLFGIILFFSFKVDAQSVDEIVNNHINAIGGMEKLRSIKDIYMEGDIEFVGLPVGNKGPVKICLINGKGVLNDIGNRAPKIAECFTPKSGWFSNTLLNDFEVRSIPEAQLMATEDQLIVGGPLFNYADRGSKIELLGREEVDGINTYKIKLINKEGAEYVYLIDPSTYYILKVTSRLKIKVSGYPIETITTFNDYDYQKTENGYVAPLAWSTDYIYTEGKQTITFMIKKIEIDKEIDESIFEMPQ